MTKIPFRKLVFLIAVFSTHGQNFSQRWVPEDDFNHIKTFDNVLDQTISSLSLIKPSEENGKKYCRKIPYGKKQNSKGEFLNNQKEQKVISRMRYLRIEGMTFQKIADVLNGENILPREGGTWRKQVISKILKRTAAEPCQKAPAMAK